ncbi:MAG: hypothetical protein NUV68_05725 [Caldiserica bacterium]|nr:hypothetical protein [Caldisericota bacterium]MDH7562825.1 hypothetical protein [Caldisericota bacterium]
MAEEFIQSLNDEDIYRLLGLALIKAQTLFGDIKEAVLAVVFRAIAFSEIAFCDLLMLISIVLSEFRNLNLENLNRVFN